GPHADQARLRSGVPEGRRDRVSDGADARVRPRRKDERPAVDVPHRRVHVARVARGAAGDQRPERARKKWSADWFPDHRPPARRRDGPRPGIGRGSLSLSVLVEPLSEATLSGLRALFDACHSTCFCRYWHFSGTKNEWLDRCANRPEENSAELEAAVRAQDP